MKALFVLNQLGVGGIQRKAALLVAGLVERGHKVDVATFYGGGPFAEPIERAGGLVVPLGESGQYGARTPVARAHLATQRLGRLRRLVWSGRYDVVYGLGATAGVYATLASTFGGPRVAWGIELIPIGPDDFARYVPIVGRRADLVIAVSHDVRDALLARGFSADRTIVIENGVDVERFRIEPDWRNAAREELDLPREAVVVGTIGRLTPVKRIEAFLDACAIIASREKRARFLVVGSGDGAYVDGLKRHAAGLGLGERLLWLGAREDVERHYNALDLYLSTSGNEGLPLARIEALACGTPCVVTDVGDARETVGRYGAVVPVDDTAGIANAALELLDGEGPWSREEIRASVVDRFSAERQVERTEAALLRVVSSVAARCDDRVAESRQGIRR